MTPIVYGLLAGTFGIFSVMKFRRFLRGGLFTEPVSAIGKVAVVTGANTGIGLETVRELNKRGAKVYMLCRNEQRAVEAIRDLEESGCDASRLSFINCDLSRKENVRACAKTINDLAPSIDILINNAGLTVGKYQLTVDGHEMTWATNHLGPFLLTELLLPLIENAPEGRIVNVSSIGHTKSPRIDLASIDGREGYTTGKAYCRSKLANVMHARELTRRLRARGVLTVTANSLHPGFVATDIARDLPFWIKLIAGVFTPFLKSKRDGAQTTLYCALSTEVKGVSGEYFSDCARKDIAPLALDDLAAKQLYDYSLKAVGL